jgi:hypothetical protein
MLTDQSLNICLTLIRFPYMDKNARLLPLYGVRA